ncbi:universal stress protein [Mangrovimonas sp. DI 80]|uniref:universal stress protein n=1 Tax=Mangrovimonas sp. DI 80 TaxID=1779330 RepID=UPI000975467A|nr:universal stress protein [Mangrovimonas sp. DI 80]OMP32062.1 hypothetical protein BKM32_03125 [Mangrovimonas sp. DI 80]
MESKAHHILVLSDLGVATEATLKSAISLANMIQGNIELFHVKRAGDIVHKENQLSAMRSINEEKSSTKKKIQELIQPISEAYGIEIPFNFAFGNVKNEIASHIKGNRPDIIVMGKKQSKLLGLGSDGLTQFVMEEFKGILMIVGSENSLEPKHPLSLGVFNGNFPSFAGRLLAYTKQPLKSFKIANGDVAKEEQTDAYETVEYVFESGDQSIKNMSSYLSKSNVNLFCVDRGRTKTGQEVKTKHSDITNIVNNFNISLLISAQ